MVFCSKSECYSCLYLWPGGPSHLDVRLADGGYYNGRVEVYDASAGVWGSVCGANWDLSDAEVVGHQLGLETRSETLIYECV